MEFLIFCSRLILAAVFGVSGTAKLNDRAGTRQAIVSFGLPEFLAEPISLGLPILEILISVMMLPLATARPAGMLALLLLCAFEIGIAANLVRGRSPDCHCFGQLHSKPLSWGLFARNLVFLVLAALIVGFGPGFSVLAWLSALTAGEAISLLLSLASLGLLLPMYLAIQGLTARQDSVLQAVEGLKRVLEEDALPLPQVDRPTAVAPGEGLPVGIQAPDFSLPSVSGRNVSLSDLVALGNWTVLIFVSTNCAPCRTLLPLIKRWEQDYREHLTFVLISKGSADEVHKRIKAYHTEHLLLHGESGLAATYQAPWTPAAVLISPDGKIASPVRGGNDAIRALVEHTVTLAASRTSTFIPDIAVGSSLFKVGEPAPRFSTSDLRGNPVPFNQLPGRPNLLLFWASSCPHCLRMKTDFARWQKDAPDNSPRLLILASGEEAEIAEHLGQVDCLVLMDKDFQIGPLFGVTSTPSGILLDAEGRISSSLATGAKHVLALAGVPYVEPQDGQ